MFFKRKKDKLKERYIRRCRAAILEQEREKSGPVIVSELFMLERDRLMFREEQYQAFVKQQEQGTPENTYRDRDSKLFVKYTFNEREPRYNLGVLLSYIDGFYSKYGRGGYSFQIWGLHKPCLETAEQSLYIDVFDRMGIKIAQFKLGDIRRRENGETGV